MRGLWGPAATTLGVPLSHSMSRAPQMEGWGTGSFPAFFMLCSVTEGGGLGLTLDGWGVDTYSSTGYAT